MWCSFCQLTSIQYNVGSDGGGRDVSKRSKMGEIAGRLCDYVVISDVNCYDEDPAQIAEMLAIGARQAGKKENENFIFFGN
jgi:UDP-N-acetylmuramoyl-L-alanyl-D-glutamate--2,6-diaminopimelate ligase